MGMFHGGTFPVLPVLRKTVSLIGCHDKRHISHGRARPVITPEKMFIIRADSVARPKSPFFKKPPVIETSLMTGHVAIAGKIVDLGIGHDMRARDPLPDIAIENHRPGTFLFLYCLLYFCKHLFVRKIIAAV